MLTQAPFPLPIRLSSSPTEDIPIENMAKDAPEDAPVHDNAPLAQVPPQQSAAETPLDEDGTDATAPERRQLVGKKKADSRQRNRKASRKRWRTTEMAEVRMQRALAHRPDCPKHTGELTTPAATGLHGGRGALDAPPGRNWPLRGRPRRGLHKYRAAQPLR